MAGQGRGLGRLVNALRTSVEFWQHLCGRGGWGRARAREKDGGVARCICNRSFIIIEGEYAITAPNLNLYIEDLPVSLSLARSRRLLLALLPSLLSILSLPLLHHHYLLFSSACCSSSLALLF